MATKSAGAKKKPPPWMKDKPQPGAKTNAKSDGRGKQSTTTEPSTGTAADQRLKGRGAKPGPKKGTAAAKKGSAAGGRASRKRK